MNIQTIDLILMIVSSIALMIFIALAYMSVKANKEKSTQTQGSGKLAQYANTNVVFNRINLDEDE
ncbi:MAG: hypothetical protein RR959_06095 [Erysipelotrichaceae bacterium]